MDIKDQKGNQQPTFASNFQSSQNKKHKQSKSKIKQNKNTAMFQETYLVLSATGKQGGAVVDALISKNANIFGSSRNPESLKKNRGTSSSV